MSVVLAQVKNRMVDLKQSISLPQKSCKSITLKMNPELKENSPSLSEKFSILVSEEDFQRIMELIQRDIKLRKNRHERFVKTKLRANNGHLIIPTERPIIKNPKMIIVARCKIDPQKIIQSSRDDTICYYKSEIIKLNSFPCEDSK